MAIVDDVLTGIIDPQYAIDQQIARGEQALFGGLAPFMLGDFFGSRPWPYPILGYIVKFNNPMDYVQFHINPHEYTEDYGANYAKEENPGRALPLQQYGSGKEHTIKITLFFNDWFMNRPIQMATEEAIQWLYGATQPEEIRGARVNRAPPLLSLVWGNSNSVSLGMTKFGLSLSRQGVSFNPGIAANNVISGLANGGGIGGMLGVGRKMSTQGKFVLENISIKRTILDRFGRARRALVDITLLEYKEAPI